MQTPNGNLEQIKMRIERENGFMLLVDRQAVGLVGKTLEEAKAAATPHLVAPKSVRIEEYPNEIRPMRTWYFDYDLKDWVQGV
jgi:hypothetical protein